MFTGKDAANPSYPTQWALNPTAYQNIDASQVDWAALAQQWIAMKEAVTVVGAPPAKVEAEGGEAPMEVENPSDVVTPPGSEWNANSNSWSGGSSWNQWSWGWPGSGPIDPKVATDPSIAIGSVIDGYTVPEGAAPVAGYTTGTVPTPTFQHGYWTAPQSDQADSTRGRSSDRRSKSTNREIRPPRSRSHRDKTTLPPLVEPIIPPVPPPTTLDAAKRRQLPAWIREGLEKMEREKQRALEREQEAKAREEAEAEQKRMEQEALERMKAEAGASLIPVKSKFDSDSEAEESEKEEQTKIKEEAIEVRQEIVEPEPIKRSKEEIMQEVMLAVRRSLTEILLEVTDLEIQTVCLEELARYTSVQASRLNAMKASQSKAFTAISSGLGLGAYESSNSSEDEEDVRDLSDQQLQEIIRRRRLEFERTSREIEAEVRRAEMRETGEEQATPNATPEKPRKARSSVTPPPLDGNTPEKKPERRLSKDKRANYKSTEKVDGVRKLETTVEDKYKERKHSKYEKTPSPQKNAKNESSSSSNSENSSSSSSSSSSESEPEVIETRSKKRKRKSSSSSDSQKQLKRHKKEKSHRNDKSPKLKDSKKDKHSKKDDRGRDSEEEKAKKRSKKSRSLSSGRRHTRDRSDDRSRRRDKRSLDKDAKRDRSYDKHDRESKRDRSYDRSGRDYDRSDRDSKRDRSYDRSNRDDRDYKRGKSYEKSSRDYDRSDRRDRSYDRHGHDKYEKESRRRDKSYERSGRNYDKSDRDRRDRSYDRHDRRDYERRRSRSGSRYRHRR